MADILNISEAEQLGILTALLERNADLVPDDTALVQLIPPHDEAASVNWQDYGLIEAGLTAAGRSELTWQQFDDVANKVANLLLSQSVGAGDKVAILLMNCIEWLPIYFGVLKTGATVVPINFRFTGEEIAYCLDLSDSSILFFGPEFIERIDGVRPQLSAINTFYFVGDETPAYATNLRKTITSQPSTRPNLALNAKDDAAIYFSSGTTGFPKAILHTQESLFSAVITEQHHHGQSKDDVFILIPPLYHTGAKMHWFGSLISASKAIILKGTDPAWILQTAAAEQATVVWLLVPWAQDILDYIDANQAVVDKLDLSHWRLMHIGAQPVPPALVQRWKQHFPKHDYDTNYGLSESIGPGSVHLGIENIHKVGAIGKAGYNWDAKIVDPDGNEVRAGDVGELIVKGPGVMKEYYNDPEATAATLKNGWLFTGDMARLDEDGFIFLVDRKKDVIITGGENIYPVQIEDFLHRNNKIKDVAVIGVGDNRLGEIALAIIELKPGEAATEEEMQEFMQDLPRYKRPRQIVFDSVPRNPTGKIEKPKLREKYHALSVVAQQTGQSV